jgi:hypothetical protein
MKLMIATTLAALATPAYAQDSHAGHAGHAGHADHAAPDAAGKAVLDKHLPGMAAHAQYEMAKTMSLRQLAAFAPDRLTPELLARVESDLAAVK